MATQKKIIGKLPVYRDEYSASVVYYKHNIVTYLGSAFISTKDENTNVPCTVGDKEFILSDGWKFFSDSSEAYFMDERFDEMAEVVVTTNDEGDVSFTEPDVVNEAIRKTPQSLSKAEQTQARTNIGAASVEENAEFLDGVEGAIAEVDAKVSDIGSEVDDINRTLGVQESSGNFYEGNAFRGCVINANVKVGEKIQLSIDGDIITDKTIYVYATDVIDSVITNDTLVGTVVYGETSEYTINSDNKYIFIYVKAESVQNSGTLNLRLTKSSSVEYRLEELKPLKEEVKLLSEDIKANSEDILEIRESIGELPKEEVEKKVNLSEAVVGAARRSMVVGAAENYSTSESYSRRECTCRSGQRYHVTTKCFGAGESNYLYFIHVIDDKGIVLQAMASRTEDETEFYLTISEGGVRLVISSFESVEKNTSEAYLYATPSVVDLINNKAKGEMAEESVTSINDYIGNKCMGYVMSKLYSETETKLINDSLLKLAELNKNKRLLNFAFITDTHHDGTYIEEKDMSPIRSIEALKMVGKNELIDFVSHGGDISTSYGCSWEQYKNRLRSAMGSYKGITKPFYICKGNHDAVNNGSDPVNVMAESVDWDNNTYFVIEEGTFSEYKEVTKDEWNGIDQLYLAGSRSDKLFPDSEFFQYTNAWAKQVVKDENNPKGCYYYVDYDVQKVRIVLLNAEQVSDTHSFCPSDIVGQQLSWFAKKALNLQDKDNPSEWHILTLQHISIKDYINTTSRPIRPAILEIINAFKRGELINGNYGGHDYSADFSAQGLGNYIGNIHGHEHGYNQSFEDGFNDIGFTIAARELSTLGEDSNYGFSIISIDTDNRKIHDIIFSQEIDDREFTW